jgi:hypothetical protein
VGDDCVRPGTERVVYTNAAPAAALPWNQRLERRAAASTSELDRPAACLNSRPKPRTVSTHEMEMFAHHGIAANFDAEQPCRLAQAIKNPIFAVAIVLPGERVRAAKEGPSDASGDAVINTDTVFNDDLVPGVWRHRCAYPINAKGLTPAPVRPSCNSRPLTGLDPDKTVNRI